MAFSERAKSQTKDLCKHNCPKFQTKLKSRGGNRSAFNVQNSIQQRNDENQKSRIQKGGHTKSFHYNGQNCKLNDDFNKTSSQLQSLNFSHHNPSQCVCSQCTCGRHLCQFHAIKPDLSKNTIYQKDYFKKNPVQNKINISKQYDRLKGPNLEINTIYLKDYEPKAGQIQRLHPEDLLKTGGPCNKLTSYTSGFPGYKCGNQYVKPTDRHTRGSFPLRSRSTYSNNFTGNQARKDERFRIPDNLKTGYNWYGNTTYNNYFKQPNPEDYAHKYKIQQKLEINPDYDRQYETVYRKSFLGSQPGVCRAKVILQTGSKGFFSNSKAKFTQNTDFKALDPSFHAISTSKHFYV